MAGSIKFTSLTSPPFPKPRFLTNIVLGASVVVASTVVVVSSILVDSRGLALSSPALNMDKRLTVILVLRIKGAGANADTNARIARKTKNDFTMMDVGYKIDKLMMKNGKVNTTLQTWILSAGTCKQKVKDL